MTRKDDSPRRGRWPLYVFGALMVALLIFVVVLHLLLDPELFRDEIEGALEETTGWNVELGSIELEVLGGLALQVEPARLAAPGETSSMSVGALRVDAALLPLFRSELEVRRVELIEPTIILVKPSEDQGWVLPRAEGREDDVAPGDERGSAGAGGDAALTIHEVEIEEGRVSLIDRSGATERSIGLEGLDVALFPEEMRLEGAGRLEGDDGRLRLSTDPEGGWRVALDGVDSGALGFFIDESLLRPGGRLSGSIEARSLQRIEGRLSGSDLPLLAGEEPLPSLEVAFALVSGRAGYALEGFELSADALSLLGGGTISPALDLEFQLPRAELDPALETLRAFFPIPVDMAGPGWIEGEARVRSRGGEIVYSARGRAEAARFVAGGPLPPVSELAARFALDEAGVLRIDIDEARAAEGPLRGVARLEPVYPPGTLSFEGELDNAVMGQLLAGFVGEKAAAIRGPTSLETALAMDLSRGELSPASLSGTLSLRSVDLSLPGWDLEGALYRKLDEKLEKLGALRSLVEGELGDRARLSDEWASVDEERLVEQLGSDVVFSGPPWTLEGVDVRAGNVRARGGGSFDPDTGKLDLRLSAQLSKKATTRLVEKEKALAALVDREGHLTLPLSLEGPITTPRIGVEVGDLLRSEGTKDALEGLVEGLFGKRKKDD